ncbi:MAG: SurA N-terminal domain-containing protein [Bradyrhizobiaceae bacterium]|nr:SurA N-terminal domain-containing protein [Bradyrhizobiaceae bacterium]
MIWPGAASGLSDRLRFGPLAAVAGCLAAALTAPSAAFAQHVVLKVNGEVITDYDVEQRTKFIALANHKTPSRKEVIEELIDDKLKAGVARRYKIDLTDKDVDAQYADMAKRMHLTADQLTQTLGQSGVDDKTLKAKILADLSWQYIIRGRFKESLQVSEKSVNDEVAKSDNKHAAEVGYDYTMRPILFLVPHGNTAMLEARRKDADVLRARFSGCDTGLPAARAQHDVVIREPITRNSSDLVPALRDILNKTEVGHLTPPETTEDGVSMFALCDKKATPTETPEKRAAREKIFSDQFQAKSKAYLRELRRQAMIERTQ